MLRLRVMLKAGNFPAMENFKEGYVLTAIHIDDS
jgi:hypothetical protein